MAFPPARNKFCGKDREEKNNIPAIYGAKEFEKNGARAEEI